MNNKTKILHTLGMSISEEIPEIDARGFGLMESYFITVRELITDNERRTAKRQLLWLHQYHLKDDEKKELQEIVPLTDAERSVLAAIEVVTNALCVTEVPYEKEYLKNLCHHIAKTISSMVLPE